MEKNYHYSITSMVKETTVPTIESSSVVRRRLWVTRLVVLVAFLDLFMQFPVVAPYALSLMASTTLVGVTVAMYSGTNLVGNVIAGLALDRWGRRGPVLGGLLVSAAALLGYVLAATPYQLLVARAVHGLAAASLTPGAFAIMGDAAPAGSRARVMGLSGAIIALAAVAGPAIAGVMRDRVGSEAVFSLSAALMVVTFFVFWFLVKDETRGGHEASVVKRQVWFGFSSVLKRTRLVVAYIAALALTTGLGILVTHLPLIFGVRGESAAQTGITFSVFAVVAMVAMASPLNRISDRYGRLAPMTVGLALVSAGMLVLGLVGNTAGAMTGMGIFGGGFGILFPAVTALVSEESEQHERGKAFGVFYAVYSLGVVIGSLLSGHLATNLGESSGMPFIVGMIVALAAIPVIVCFRLYRNRGHQS
ncbi:MFS transporter [Chloroflexota bacterium]